MDKQSASSHPAIQQLIKWVESTVVQGLCGLDGDMRDVNFVSHRALNDYFDQEDVLENLLRAHFPDNDQLLERSDARQIKRSYPRILIKRSYPRIFCLLILIGKGKFINHFVEYGISDQRLPLNKHKPVDFPADPSDPSDSHFFDTFLQHQWQFSVPELSVTYGRRFDPSETILPIRKVKRLGQGVSADIHQVEVHSSYDQLEADYNAQSSRSDHSSVLPIPKTYVLKSYRNVPHAEKYWNNEWQALKRLHGHGTCPNIVGFHGSFVLGGIFHILLEYADMGTLEDYLTANWPPFSPRDIITFWKSVLGITRVLVRIHNSPAPDILSVVGGPKVFQGWHQDLNPKNILIKSRPGGSVYDFECKLADLGIRNFKRSLSWEEEGTDTAAYGTRTYGAPECFSIGSSIENEKLGIKKKADIWSLGCVLSEVATWVVCNWKTVEEYRARRRIEVKRTRLFNEDADCFHNGKDELLNCVDQNHNELAQHVRPLDYVTQKVLKMIKDDMLRPSQFIGARRNASDLNLTVDHIVREAQSMTSMHPDNSLNSFSGPALIPPEPPGHTRRLTPPQPPYLPEMILQPSLFPGGSLTRNGQPHIIPQGYERSMYRQTQLVEDETANSLEPTISGTRRASTLPQRPSGRYSHKSALAMFEGQAEDPSCIPLIEHTGGISARTSGHRISNHENQNLPVPGSSPTTPERTLKSPRGDLRMQRYSASESLQHPKALPVWQVEDALKWKRVKKDPKNYERIIIPDVNDDLEKLKGRDHVFLIDNASSMIPYWSDARELSGLLCYLVKRADPNGVDLNFTSLAKHYYRIKSTTDVLKIFDQNRPRSQGHCNMSFHLSSIVNKYQRTLANIPVSRSIFGKTTSQETRPLSLYVFTDAVWRPRCDVAPVIKSLVNSLNQQNLLKQQVGIQFIRFGNSRQGMERLHDLNNLKRSNIVDMDVVDTEPANGNVLKMLLGSIVEWYDDEVPMNPPSSSPPKKSRQRFNMPRDSNDSERLKKRDPMFPIDNASSTFDPWSVSASVATFCSAYHDGAKILQMIEKKKAQKAVRQKLLIGDSTEELKQSLHRGEVDVQNQYSTDYERFGTVYANGDELARDALKDILIHLQVQLITNLKSQWQQSIYVDFTALQDVSDSIHDKAILVLMQLQQRIINSGPIENLRSPTFFASPRITSENKMPGEEHPDKLRSMSNLGLRCRNQGRRNEAQEMKVRVQSVSEVIEDVARLLLNDSVLSPIYEAAIAIFGRERFHKNHDHLLKKFFKDLRSETQRPVQLSAVRNLQNRDRRHKITLLIQSAHEPFNVQKRQAMAVFRNQKPNHYQLHDKFSREKASISPLEQDDDFLDEGASSTNSDHSSIEPLDQDDKETCPYLEPLETFITKSNAFARFKTRLGYLLRPPTDLSEALKSHDLRVVQRFLTENFDSAATADYAWLRELEEAGYSLREIADLLLEDVSDSPWIHFTPRVPTKSSIRTNFHVPDCAHQTNFNTEPPSVLCSEQSPSYSLPLQTDVRRLVEELCGIGGVIPFSKDMSTWHGRVTFEEQFSISVITYAADPAVTRQSRNDLVARISNVLAKFCTAAAAVQSTGLCCDSFTVLLRKQDCLELRRLEFCHALTMSSNINLALQNNDTEAAIQQCVQSAECVLRELKMPIANTTSNADLHYCALAAQFLCSAFLSYVQAHVGSIDPFFLDKPQRKMVLLGSQCVLGGFAIYASLVELTCLAEMTQQPVFAFSLGATSQEARPESGMSRYDVLASPEDCLDTWGPGYFVYSKVHPSNIHAIALGGGFVSLVDRENSRFHWAKGQLSESASWATFEMHTLMRIGTGVNINEKCCIDEAVYRESSFSALQPLGTHEVFWETQERHAGVQGGQYLIGTYSQTWRKVPGTTLKQRTLQQADWRLMDFLEQSWGLQVSFCTSVARRVSLRELVTDLLPIFVNPLEQDIWQELVSDHNVIQAFTQGNIFAWLRTLSPSLQQYVLSLVRAILDQLQYTGLDRQKNTLVIAWPQKNDLGRGVKIPCKAETCWAQVIADAEDCATFAYVTSRCLETNHVKCQGSLRAWQNASKMLVTEMSPSGLNGQPLVAASATITAIPLASVTATITAKTQWELEDQKVYYIKKLDSLLRVKVERPCSTSNDVAHLVVMTSHVPQGLWKRLLLRGEEKRNHWIRERQAIGDRAELVVVRAG